MFKKAIQLAPLNYRGYLNLAGSIMNEDTDDQAVEALKQSAELQRAVIVISTLAPILLSAPNYYEIDSWRQAPEIDDKDWPTWGNLGDTLHQIPSRRPEAMDAHGKAVERAKVRLDVNPRDAEILAFAADHYAMLGSTG